jgi:hypothetical protein
LLSCAPAPVTFTSGTVFNAPPGACYTVPPGGVRLNRLSNVVINGGLWQDPNKDPCPYKRCPGGTERGRPAIEVVGGTANTLENMTVTGINVGGPNVHLAFNAGIEVEGSVGTSLPNDHVAHTFGDSLDLEPIRSGTGSNGVVTPVTDLTVTNFSGTATGRNGVTCASVDGATFTNLVIGSAAQDDIDCEADQAGGEGAKNLTIDGGSWNGLVAINAGGESTGPITINDLVMTGAGSGDALRVLNRDGSKPAGPITIEDSAVRCSQSQSVACLTLSGADVVMSHDSMDIGFNYPGSVPTAIWHAANGTTLTFVSTTVTGRFKKGSTDATSKVVNPIGVVK